MGRRRKTRRRRILRPPKKLPKVFTCPACGTGIVNVVTDKKSGQVRVKCGSCGLEATFPIMTGLLPVDYYNKMVDMYYQGLLKPKKEEVISISELAKQTVESEEVVEEVESVESSEETYEEGVGEAA